MANLTDAVARARANQYSGSGSWLDESGNSHDAALPGGTNDPTFIDHTGTSFIRCPNVASNTLTTPDATAHDIVDDGDIDIRVRAAMIDWTPAAIQYFISKNPAGGATGWGAYIDTAGKPVFEMGDGSNRTAVATVATGVTDGNTKWIGYTYDSSAGLANLYTSDTNIADITGWTQLGDANVAISGGTTATNNADDVEIGSSAGAERLLGNIFEVEVRDGINGSLITDFDADDWGVTAEVPDATYTDGQSKVWTLNQSGTAEMIRLVDRAHWWFDTDDFLEAPDDAALDFANGEDMTIGIAGRRYDWDLNTRTMLGKWSGAAGGYRMQSVNTSPMRYLIDDNTNVPEDTITAPSDGAASTIIGVRNTGDDDIEIFEAGTGSGTPTTDSTTSTLATANTLRIGADTPGNYWLGEIWSYAIIRSALSDAEVGTGADTLHDNLLNQTVPATANALVATIASVGAVTATLKMVNAATATIAGVGTVTATLTNAAPGPSVFTIPKTWKAGSTMIASDFNTHISTNMDVANQWQLAVYSSGAIATTGAVPSRWRAPYALTVKGVWLSAGTASTTGSVVLDILRTTADNGTTATTLFTSSSELPTLTSGKTETTSATVPDVTAISSGHILTVNYVAVGSTATKDVSLVISVTGA